MKKRQDMIKIAVLGFNGALASAITGIVDMLSLVGVSWQRIQNIPVHSLFQVKISSPNGQPLDCINGMHIAVKHSYADVMDADVFIVPTIGREIIQTLEANTALITYLKNIPTPQKSIAANCTGNFFLAEAGLLDGKTATTHWGYAEFFSHRYPLVHLNRNLLISRDGEIYCAGGGLAWFDLALHLTERFYGIETAIQTAKAFVYHRDALQTSYSLLNIAKAHQDQLVKKVQIYLSDHLKQELNFDDVAMKFNVTNRTLIRHFNTALGLSPNQYLLALRIEATRKYLEETQHSIEQIMQHVGYSDASSFRRLFRKKTGLTPVEYRRHFSRQIIHR